MANGYTGTILRVDLSTGKIEKQAMPEAFYRTYLGGGAFGAYFLLKETSGDLDPLDEKNIITIAPGITTAAPVSGASRCSVTSLSPETGTVGDSQAGGSIGPMIKRAGFDAIVVTGKAKSPSYLFVDGDNIEIRDAGSLWGKTVLEVHDTLTEELGKSKLSILQCGPAGENMVRFACLMADLNNAAGRNGLGAVFGSKNLRAIAVRGTGKVSFADPEALKEMAKLAGERLPGSGFPEILKKLGTPGVVIPQTEGGNLATHNFSRSWHESYKNLDGSVFEPKIGAGQTTCLSCIVGCRKKVKAEEPYQVSDKLGGPEFETLGLLGSNLDITDAVAVAKANELCNNYGLDTISVGGVAGYLFECLEKGLIGPEDVDGENFGFGNAEGLFNLIERIALRNGVGDVLADGLTAAVARFGEKTKPFAIHVKNKPPAVHMAQVKPSMALMYAINPIGSDHMSSEHDWLLSSESDISKGLGILGGGELSCTDVNKVRMTVYSQYFYSTLDAMCLCMFCWGCGSLYTYRDLEDLVRYTTGWECTIWELMKAGERRVNMLRLVNERRGFTREHDKLPARLFEPLPDGPAKEKCVDSEAFPVMLEQFYGLMGWDTETGNPCRGKLLELGLEWAG